MAAYKAGGITQRAGVVKGRDLLDIPAPGLSLFPIENYGLFQRERAIAFAMAKALNMVGAGMAEKEPE